MRKTILIGVISAALATACTAAFADAEVKVIDIENAASLFTVEELAEAGLMAEPGITFELHSLHSELAAIEAFERERMSPAPGAVYAMSGNSDGSPVPFSDHPTPFGGAAGHSAATGIRPLLI